MRPRSCPAFPIERTAVQMHDGFYVKDIMAQAVNDCIRKPAKIELAIFAAEFAPACWRGDNAPEGALKLIQKIVTQPTLLFIIPECGGFQLVVGLRMPDDVHEAFSGCAGQLSPKDG